MEPYQLKPIIVTNPTLPGLRTRWPWRREPGFGLDVSSHKEFSDSAIRKSQLRAQAVPAEGHQGK